MSHRQLRDLETSINVWSLVIGFRFLDRVTIVLQRRRGLCRKIMRPHAGLLHNILRDNICYMMPL